MKKIITLAVVALVAIGAGVLSMRHYNQNKPNKVNAAQSEIDRLTQELEAERAKSALYLTKYDVERIECEKGKAAYDILSTAQAKRLHAPQCGPAIINE